MLDDTKVLYKFEKLAKAKEKSWAPREMDEFIIKARPIP